MQITFELNAKGKKTTTNKQTEKLTKYQKRKMKSRMIQNPYHCNNNDLIWFKNERESVLCSNGVYNNTWCIINT